MLDLRYLVDNVNTVKLSLKKRGHDTTVELIDEIVGMDKERRERLQEVEALKHQRNQASGEIAKLKSSGGDASILLNQMKEVSAKIKEHDEKVKELISSLGDHLAGIPNVLSDDVPEGKSAQQNVEVRSWGEKPHLKFEPKTHWEIGERLGILDFKKAGDVTGSRFVFLKGLAARLELALIRLMMDTHAAKGYTEMVPPFLVNRESLYGTGQLPKFEEDVFRIEKFDFFLIPTAEVPITNYHRGEILEESDLPKNYVAYSPCFRSEAGSYGKETKGLKRQHQFNKVELVKFVHPDRSFEELDVLVADAEKILQILQLPYRVVALCGGDTGFSSAKTYDIEVWSPVANGYMEISSVSNFTDFQARRANIRFRSAADKKVHHVHTLNGSGLAVGRTLIAIMENFQDASGNFAIPPVLQPYM